jgi:hypothetical protein
MSCRNNKKIKSENKIWENIPLSIFVGAEKSAEYKI